MDVMDIANLATVTSQTQLMNNVGMAVLDMSLDSFETQSDGLVKMMEQSVQPYLGSNIDTYA